MKELDNNFIEAFAAQYWNQEVVKTTYSNDLLKLSEVIDHPFCRFEEVFKYIELRSIDNLTDEECIEVFDILFSHISNYNSKPKDFKINLGKYWANNINQDTFGQLYSKNYICMIDYLRSIGIAVPFRSVSVETIIESGKLKLRK